MLCCVVLCCVVLCCVVLCCVVLCCVVLCCVVLCCVVLYCIVLHVEHYLLFLTLFLWTRQVLLSAKVNRRSMHPRVRAQMPQAHVRVTGTNRDKRHINISTPYQSHANDTATTQPWQQHECSDNTRETLVSV